MEEVASLGSVPLFSTLEPEDLAELASKLRRRNYQASEIIFHKDDPGATLYIIRSGKVKITTTSPQGKEVMLNILNDNDFFGELCLLDGGLRSARAVAMEDTQALTLNREDLLAVTWKKPGVANRIIEVLCERLRHATILLEDAIFLDLPGRLAKRLLEFSEKHGLLTNEGIEINLRMTQQDLADSLGASRESVNKLLRIFEDKGLITIKRHRIHITSADKLRKLSCSLEA